DADKAAVRTACEAAVKAKRGEISAKIKASKAAEYAAAKTKMEAYLATLSEADKAAYIKKFNDRFDSLLQIAEEKGQDTTVINLEATSEILNEK
ncbi:MAG: hypothetical protein WCK88_07945, partial [bacterium]